MSDLVSGCAVVSLIFAVFGTIPLFVGAMCEDREVARAGLGLIVCAVAWPLLLPVGGVWLVRRIIRVADIPSVLSLIRSGQRTIESGQLSVAPDTSGHLSEVDP